MASSDVAVRSGYRRIDCRANCPVSVGLIVIVPTAARQSARIPYRSLADIPDDFSIVHCETPAGSLPELHVMGHDEQTDAVAIKGF
jgi:hypothetical protein